MPLEATVGQIISGVEKIEHGMSTSGAYYDIKGLNVSCGNARQPITMSGQALFLDVQKGETVILCITYSRQKEMIMITDLFYLFLKLKN